MSSAGDDAEDKKPKLSDAEEEGSDEEVAANEPASSKASDDEGSEKGEDESGGEESGDDDDKAGSSKDSKGSASGSEEGSDEEAEDGEKELTESQMRKKLEKEERKKMRELKKEQKEALQAMRDQQNKEVEASRTQTHKDKLKFLLQQTDIYTHFMKSSETKDSGKKGATPTKRGTKTERAEDEQLLKDTVDETSTNKVVYLTATPAYIKNGTMREYQVHGLNWLIKLYDNGINGILADEMGLGKTLQTISFLGYLKEIRGVPGPHMVVAPKSTLGNWLNEFAKWCPSIRTLRFHGSKDERVDLRENKLQPGKFDVCVTTYEIAIKEKAALSKFSWRYIVIDEAHRIKNENSSLSQIVRMYNSQYRLLITGTPLQNNLHELWALLNFLLPDVFSSSEDFDNWFKLEGSDAEGNAEVVQKLHKILRPFLLRRLKADVEKSLLPKKEILLFVGMSQMQKEWYRKLLSKDLEVINSSSKNKSMKVRLLNIIMQLRKCCNHPYLFDGAEPGPPYTTGDHLVTNSGKMIVLDKLLPKLKAQGSRVLIFSQMTRVLDILEDYMMYKDYKYARIDGQTNGEDREESIDLFNKPNSPLFAFLLSTRAGGLGINLATADTVILYDSDWNPQVDLQAQDRAHRIGQTKQVKVFRFVAEDTMEEKIIERAEMKLQLDALVIQQGRMVDTNKAVGQDELLSMIKYGADQIFSSKNTTITDQDIDAILSRGEEKTQQLNDKIKQHSKKMMDFSSDGMNIWNYDGTDYSQQDGQKQKKIGSNMFWIEPAKRERKVNGYAVDEYYRNALRVSAPRKPGAPKPPRQILVHDFQFFPTRLRELMEKELAGWLSRAEAKNKPDPTSPVPTTPPSSSSLSSSSSSSSTLPPTTTTTTTTTTSSEEKKEDANGETEKEKEKEKETAMPKEKSKEKAKEAADKDKEKKKEKQEEKEKEKATEEKEDVEMDSASEKIKPEAKEDEKMEDDKGDKGEKDEEGDEEEGDEKKKGKGKKVEERVSDLTPEEQLERDELMKEGFADWTRKDFTAFIKGCEKFGRKQYSPIAEEIGTKTAQQVKEYAKVFWARHTEIANYEKYIKSIEKAEGGRQRLEEMKKHLDKKMARYKDPLQQMKIVYSSGSKGKTYIEAEDVFLVCMMHKLGYGEWEKLKMEVRKAWQFRFDWFIKSRTTIELSKRCDVLMRMIEKENQDIEEKERERERQREAEKRKKDEKKKSTPTKKGKAPTAKTAAAKGKPKAPAKKAAKATDSKKSTADSKKAKPATTSSSRKRKDKADDAGPSKKVKVDKD